MILKIYSGMLLPEKRRPHGESKPTIVMKLRSIGISPSYVSSDVKRSIYSNRTFTILHTLSLTSEYTRAEQLSE